MTAVLITGGAGFIGSTLGQSLLRDGEQVRVLDNLDPFYAMAQKRRNLADLEAVGGARFEFVEGDIRDREVCRRATAGVEVVVHLAALAGVRPSIAEPARYMDVNVTGTQILLDAVGSGVRFVFGSSSSVYGGNTKVPFAEGDAVEHPVSPYAASKRAGELIAWTWHHLRGNPVTCLRFFTVYGPRQRPEMAIHQFARRIVAGDEIPFFGDGTSARDYTYVDDIVAGVRAAMARRGGYAIYNLGGSETTTLDGMVQALELALGKPAKRKLLPDQPGDVPITWADVARAERDLGYRPQVPFAVGVRRFCDWYVRERRAGSVA